MSLVGATLAASASVRAVTAGAGRAGTAFAVASGAVRPSITVTVGLSNDAYARIFTRLEESVGNSKGDRAAGAVLLALFTDREPIVGMTRADRMASDIYRLVFASHAGLSIPGYSAGGGR